MKNRLRRHEKEAIHNKYKDLPLYKLLYAPTKAFEREMKRFALSSDEVFMEVMDILDHIKMDKKEARNYVRSLWNTYYCDYRDLADTQVPDEEITLATSVVLYGVVMCLNQAVSHTSLSAIILTQLSEPDNKVNIPHLNETYNKTYYRLNAQQIADSFADYMKGESQVSQEIEVLLSNLPQMPVEELIQTNDNQDRISNRQLVLLFLELFNVPLDQSTNISAFSKFLAFVSGRSAGGIRDIINRKEVDYDSDKTREDLALLAQKIAPFAPRIAARLKDQ